MERNANETQLEPARRTALHWVLPLLFIAASVTIGAVLIRTPVEAPKSSPRDVKPVVSVADLTPRSERVYVEAFGTVIAARDVRIQPEVGGRIVELHPQLLPGGIVGAGETLFRIDPADYEIAVTQAQADVQVAKIQIERLRASVESLRSQLTQSKAEFEYLQWNAQRLSGLREDQHAGEVETRDAQTKLASQEAAVAGLEARIVEQEKSVESAAAEADVARSRLDAARLALARTQVQAPFTAIVLTENVELGQLVSPQTSVGRLAATDEFWVEAAVPVARLPDIRLPAPGESTGAKVEVKLATGDTSVVRDGHVVRSLGDLDPQGRMARVLVAIDDPLALKGSDADQSRPILLGSFVRLAIHAGVLQDVYAIPRMALRENDRVWVRDGDGTLGIRGVKIVWRRQDDVLVRDGFESGDELITSHLASVVPGMPLDVRRSPTTGMETAERDETAAAP